MYGRRSLPLYNRFGGAGGVGIGGLGAGVGSAADSVPAARRNRILAFLAGTFLYAIFLNREGGAGAFLGGSRPDPVLSRTARRGIDAMIASGRTLTVATWNVAAINNNPFEYWLTADDRPEYEELMVGVEKFLESPGDGDVVVEDVFTDDMYRVLEGRMEQVGWPSVRTYWETNFRKRKIVSGFLKDPALGSKRLASMPDRVTNTINVVGSDKDKRPVCRPTVINMYDGDLSSLQKWWKEWETFMFDTELRIRDRSGSEKSSRAYQMLLPIKRAKYPDLTEEEEKVSLPLQTLCGAIFDAILVHMMNTVSGPDVWQPIKKTIVDGLVKEKVPRTLTILQDTYGESDVIMLQEASLELVDRARHGPLGRTHHVVSPANLDNVRDQNSVILLKKETFPSGHSGEITSTVTSYFPEGVDVPVTDGDIHTITATDKDGVPLLLASFHGDTNGLATKPVLDALMRTRSSESRLAAHRLLFGLDANTYESAKPGRQQDVRDFGEHFRGHGLTSCWGDAVQPSNYTTFNARTYLQPQLNKACKSSDKRKGGDVNPKDFILFGEKDFTVSMMWKDNTGERNYVEGMAFPTLSFPSDHGILSTELRPKREGK